MIVWSRRHARSRPQNFLQWGNYSLDITCACRCYTSRFSVQRGSWSSVVSRVRGLHTYEVCGMPSSLALGVRVGAFSGRGARRAMPPRGPPVQVWRAFSGVFPTADTYLVRVCERVERLCLKYTRPPLRTRLTADWRGSVSSVGTLGGGRRVTRQPIK